MLTYKNTIIGGLIGLIVAILIFTLGFWKTVLAVLIIGTGLFIGFSMDRKVDVKEYFEDFWSNKKEWK